MKLKFLTRHKVTHDSAAMAACSTIPTDRAAPSATPACTAVADLDAAFKKVMKKLDRIEALIDALPSSRGDSTLAAPAKRCGRLCYEYEEAEKTRTIYLAPIAALTSGC